MISHPGTATKMDNGQKKFILTQQLIYGTPCYWVAQMPLKGELDRLMKNLHHRLQTMLGLPPGFRRRLSLNDGCKIVVTRCRSLVCFECFLRQLLWDPRSWTKWTFVLLKQDSPHDLMRLCSSSRVTPSWLKLYGEATADCSLRVCETTHLLLEPLTGN